MTETLSDLLRHSAEAVSAPSVDVAALVAHAGKRQRRRRITLALAAAAVVGAVTAGSLAVRGGSGGRPRTGSFALAVSLAQPRRRPDRDASARVRRGLHRAPG